MVSVLRESFAHAFPVSSCAIFAKAPLGKKCHKAIDNVSMGKMAHSSEYWPGAVLKATKIAF